MTIKEFLADCYQGLTSRASSHASQGNAARQKGLAAHAFARASTLLCRHCQKPNQQSEQNQCADKRKQCVQGVELKQWIARQSVPCRQHGDLLHERIAVATDNCFCYFPTFSNLVPAFRNVSAELLTVLHEFRESSVFLRGSTFCDFPVAEFVPTKAHPSLEDLREDDREFSDLYEKP